VIDDQRARFPAVGSLTRAESVNAPVRIRT
jgi:hypothetical protein